MTNASRKTIIIMDRKEAQLFWLWKKFVYHKLKKYQTDELVFSGQMKTALISLGHLF